MEAFENGGVAHLVEDIKKYHETHSGYYEPSVTEDGVLSLIEHNGAPKIETTWNIRGPQGPVGAAGEQGPAGKDGAKGDAGSPGAKGDTGGYYEPSVNDDGNLSLTAKNGAPAIATTWNIKGPQGLQGDQGPKGDRGPEGPPGADGAPGKDGASGKNGAPGAKGDTGGYYEPSVSDEGVLSLIAKNGAPAVDTTWDIKGPQGATGAQGPAGPAGSIGPAGPAGPQGPAGVNATTTDTATSSANGLMSSTDKQLLDSLKAKVEKLEKSSGGQISAGTSLFTGATADASASTGTSFQVPATAAEQTRKTFDVPFGAYSVVVRAKVAANTATAACFNIVAYAGTTLLKRVAVQPNHFSAANAWCPIGIGVDFSAAADCDLAVAIESATGASVVTHIDSVTVAPAVVAVNMIG